MSVWGKQTVTKVRKIIKKKKSQLRLRYKSAFSANNTYRFTRIVKYADLTSDSATPIEVNHYFSLDLLPSYTEYTALFDSYRIAKVSCMFIPINSGEPGAVATSAQVVPILVHALDFDDNTNIGTPPYEYGSVKMTPMNKSFTRTFKPKPAVGVFTSTLVTGSSQPKTSPWIDAGSPSVRHYGIRLYITDPSASVYRYRMLVKYYIECKQTR